MKRYLRWLFEASMRLNRDNILAAVRDQRPERLLDLGCDDGAWTKRVAEASGAGHVTGLETVVPRAAEARARGFEVVEGDLSVTLPFADRSFDLVHANQVIEHVPDVDLFTAEVFRVLRPNGLAVLSTENGSSWHNVAASALGWQAFSLTNVSRLRAGIGNPLSLLRGANVTYGSWTHKVIFNYRGLIEFLELHGFRDVKILGAGYHPLPPAFGRLDPRHAHFITAIVRRPG